VLQHGGDRFVFVDESLRAPLDKALATAPDYRPEIIVMSAPPAAATAAPDASSTVYFESLLASQPESFDWPDVDENAAAILCYTGGTTGDPKGVAYTHRSTVIHSFAATLVDAINIRQSDTVLPVVPMFHANAWGSPYYVLTIGAKYVLPGPKLDPHSVIDLVEGEKVTISLGVPTVWLAVRDELEKRDAYLPTLKTLLIGGSAVPPSLFDDLKKRGISILQGWGMTEMSPLGTVSFVKGELDEMPPEDRRRKRLKQGLFSPIVQWKVLDDDLREVPQDGIARGELYVRGPAIAREYFNNPGATEAAFHNGWFKTGDVVTVDDDGYMEIVDRSKDMIKSGGEWISSVELENTLMGHPSIKEACVFGVPHDKWMERPVAAVVLRDGQPPDEAGIREWLASRVAKWWLPDRIVFIDAIPRTGVGKFLKRDLRDRYHDLLTPKS
jgi:fatty-acyl-CoA synthase